MPKVLLYPNLIQESPEELLSLEKSQQKSYLRDRVTFFENRSSQDTITG